MILKTILKALKPFPLISLIMTYTLGVSLLQYIREIRNWSLVLQGGVFLILITSSLEYLRLLQQLSDVYQWPDDMTFREAKQTRLLVAALTATFMTLATTIIVGWMLGGVLWQGLILLLIALVFFGVFYYLSQTVKFLQRFQVLFEIFIFVVIPPAVAYFVQSDEVNRLLTLVVLGLVPAYLAFRMLNQLKRFRQDLKIGKKTLVIYMGWENAMVSHNALILMTYLLFGVSALLGFPWILLWPVFLTLPIGLLEIWLMERVRQGGKPHWRVMQIATALVFLFSIYLISFTFWIR